MDKINISSLCYTEKTRGEVTVLKTISQVTGRAAFRALVLLMLNLFLNAYLSVFLAHVSCSINSRKTFMDTCSKSTISKSGFLHAVYCLSSQKSDSQMEMRYFISLQF